MDKKEVVKKLIEAGGESVKNLKVKNVTVTPCENYVRLGIILDKPVKGMVTEDNVTYTEGEVNVIFVSMFSIASILKDNDDVAFAVNYLLKNPESMSVVLSRATIDIIQEHVAKGIEYKNPWSDSSDSTIFEHATIINHVTDIKLSDFAIRKVDKLADHLLGF